MIESVIGAMSTKLQTDYLISSTTNKFVNHKLDEINDTNQYFHTQLLESLEQFLRKNILFSLVTLMEFKQRI